MKPNFKQMKKLSKAQTLRIDVDQIEKDWESYLEVVAEENRKKKQEKRYKHGGHRR